MTRNVWVLSKYKTLGTKNFSFTIKKGTLFDVYEAPELMEEEFIYIMICSDTITHAILKELSLYVGDLVLFEDLVYVSVKEIFII